MAFTVSTNNPVSGNPISYYNGTRWAFGWENGRELATATNGDVSISYAYDLNGIRTTKTVDGVVHEYLYAGDKLIRYRFGNTVMEFLYDQNGAPFAMIYNGTRKVRAKGNRGMCMFLAGFCNPAKLIQKIKISLILIPQRKSINEKRDTKCMNI